MIDGDPFGIKHREILARLDAIGELLIKILEGVKE